MSQESDQPRPAPPEAEREGVPLVGQVVEKTTVVVQKTTRFSKEFVATVISLVSVAFGVVAALAWNSAITEWFNQVYKDRATKVSALFIYAVIVTLIGVTVIVLLGRLAARINAQPVEFKYPGTPKT